MIQKVFLIPLFHELLPVGHSKPVPIFDHTLRELIYDSVELNIPVAIGHASPFEKRGSLAIPDETLPFVSEVCGYGYPHVAEILSNGEMMIILRGVGKLKIENVFQNHKGYLVAEVSELYENHHLRFENVYPCQNLRRDFRRWCSRYLDSRKQREHFKSAALDPICLVGLCSEFMVQSSEVRQKILEEDDINKKIHTLLIENEVSA